MMHARPHRGSPRVRPATTAVIVLVLAALVRPAIAEQPAVTIRKSPFSSSTYRIWREPRHGPTPRSLERVIRRNPPIGPHSQTLEQRGRHFTSDRKAPYARPPER